MSAAREFIQSIAMPPVTDDTLKPSYYKQDGIECFDVIDAFGMDFYIGNVLKYISRWKSKGGVDDLRKARVYLDRRIAQAEKEAGKP